MQEFLIIAAAHFLALLSPGPDFFLVARTSMAAGWKVATGACVGIALANGVFIVAAFSGVSAFRPDSYLFVVIQLAGCMYLLYIGWQFIRYANSPSLGKVVGGTSVPSAGRISWKSGACMGFLSGILNPKNALFYVSLAAMVAGTHTSDGWKVIYGIWMFAAVLIWDTVVAAAIGNNIVRKRYAQALPWLERLSGGVLIALAVGVMVAMMRLFLT